MEQFSALNKSQMSSGQSSVNSLSPTVSSSPSRPPSWALPTKESADTLYNHSPTSSASSTVSLKDSSHENGDLNQKSESPSVSHQQESNEEQHAIGDKQHENLAYINMRGHSIICLMIDDKERVCLSQISNKLLNKYTYNEIHNRRVALGINCIQCTPSQLELLRKHGAMPITSRRCGMITRREAERLIKSFLDAIPGSVALRQHATSQPGALQDSERSSARSYTTGSLPNYANSFYLNDDNFTFKVKHKCGYGCKGYFYPSRYNSSRAKCIRCFYCFNFYSPNKFIFHSHDLNATKNRPQKFQQSASSNFNSWRRHITLITERQSNRSDARVEDRDSVEDDGDDDDIRNTKTSSAINLSNEELINAWEDVKSIFNGGKRKRQNGQLKFNRPSFPDAHRVAYEKRDVDDDFNSDYNSTESDDNCSSTSNQVERFYTDKLKSVKNCSPTFDAKRLKTQDQRPSELHFEQLPRLLQPNVKSEILFGLGNPYLLQQNQPTLAQADLANDNFVGGANQVNKINQLLNELISKSLGFNQPGSVSSFMPFFGSPARPPGCSAPQPGHSNSSSLLAPSIQMTETSTTPLIPNASFSTQFLAFKSIYESYLYESLNQSLLSNLNNRSNPSTSLLNNHEPVKNSQPSADTAQSLKMIQEQHHNGLAALHGQDNTSEGSDSSAFKSLKRKF